MTAAQSPMSEPTEMSISPVTMTKVMPQPTMAAGTALTSMSRMLSGAMKR